MKKTYLAIDGGGALGCGSAWLISKLGRKFDGYGGASVGGMLALYLCFHDPDETYEMFLGNVRKIFHAVSIFRKLNPTLSKWDNDGLIAVAKELFGDKKMTDSPYPIFVVVSDFVNGSVKVFDRTDDAYAWEVCVRTASAPTYFPPLNSRWADGGIVANNPSMVLATGLHSKEYVDFDDMRILSLATGGTFWTDPKIGSKMCELQWAPPIIHFCMQATLQFAAFQAQELLGNEYLRLDPGAPKDVAMDDLGSLEYWTGLWQALWANQTTTILDFLNRP